MDRIGNILKQRLTAGQAPQAAHPSTDLLAAFIEQGLKDAERGLLVAHLSVCAECREAIALATPEAAPDPRTGLAPRGLMQFPAAMRWASLAAALAVAVGIGVLSYERASTSGQSAQAPAPASPASESGYSTTAQKPEANIEGRALPERKQPVQQKASETVIAGLTQKKEKAAASPAKAAPMEQSRDLAKQQTDGAGRAENELRIADTFMNTREANRAAIVAGRSDQYYSAAVVARPPAAEPPSGQVFRDFAVKGRMPHSPTEGDSPPTEVAPAVSMEAMAQSEAVPPSAKSLRASAIGGSLTRAKPIYSFAGAIVRWTISTAGKLERCLRDGTVTVVEPAPGVTVRAIAAGSIEVWAGGLQPDLSATQWQQRSVLFHSSDAGETWNRIDGPWQGPIVRISLGGGDNLTVVAQDGTWTTTDAGKNWIKR